MPDRQGFFGVVWDTVRQIPRGSVTTYGIIARSIARPRGITARYYKAASARWVGQAMAQSPPDVPWHRVINAQGKISRHSKGTGHHIQRSLLESEGVLFDKGNRVDLRRFCWQPRHHRNRKPRTSA